MRHDLKCWPAEFAAIERGENLHEIRRADRPYAVGDVLVLREWVPAHEGECTYSTLTEPWRCKCCGRKWDEPLPGHYTGRVLDRVVTHLTPGGAWRLPPDLCVMSIASTSMRVGRVGDRVRWSLASRSCVEERGEMRPGFDAERGTIRAVNVDGSIVPGTILVQYLIEWYGEGAGRTGWQPSGNVSVIPPPQTPPTAGDTPAK